MNSFVYYNWHILENFVMLLQIVLELYRVYFVYIRAVF